jgi:hypothetical protein
MTPLIDLKVSEDPTLGIQELNEWGKISRGFISKENVITDGIEEEVYYFTIQCYNEKPEVDFNVILKVI